MLADHGRKVHAGARGARRARGAAIYRCLPGVLVEHDRARFWRATSGSLRGADPALLRETRLLLHARLACSPVGERHQDAGETIADMGLADRGAGTCPWLGLGGENHLAPAETQEPDLRSPYA